MVFEGLPFGVNDFSFQTTPVMTGSLKASDDKGVN